MKWIKASDNLPQIPGHRPVKIEGDYYLAYFEACDMGDYYIFSCFDNHDRRIDTDQNRDMIEWLDETESPSLPNESGLREQIETMGEMYSDQCCLTDILLKAIDKIISASGDNALEIATKAKESYDDILHMK